MAKVESKLAWRQTTTELKRFAKALKVFDETGVRDPKEIHVYRIMRPMAPEEIRALRKKLGITRQELAMAIPVGIETVKSWELGRRQPDGPSIHIMRILEEKPELLKLFLD